MAPDIVPTLQREQAAWAGSRLLVGVDEVGRGPLAGPVVAAAVVFPAGFKRILNLRDSKMLTLDERERLVLRVRQRALAIGVGAASVREIDRINIRKASALAMRRAVTRLGHSAARVLGVAPAGDLPPGLHILIDGLRLPELGLAHEALVDGDAHCASIAAASIVAKTVRDFLMRQLARRYPVYGWETNMGYGTPAHHAALNQFGPTRHHRVSFGPVSQLGFDFDAGASGPARFPTSGGPDYLPG